MVYHVDSQGVLKSYEFIGAVSKCAHSWKSSVRPRHDGLFWEAPRPALFTQDEPNSVFWHSRKKDECYLSKGSCTGSDFG